MKCNSALAILLAGCVWVFPVTAQEGKPPSDEAKTQEKPEKKKREPIYDEQADAREQIAEALVKATRENRRVLIQWGANWCSWCYLLHDHFKEDKQVARTLLYEYDLVLVDIGDDGKKNRDLAKKYDAELAGVPYLTVLDAEGNVLANQETGSLELQDSDKKGHDGEKVLAFLTQHQAPYLSAESMLADGIARAKAQGKRVFVHYGAPWCSWCKKLEAWLADEQVAEIMAKHFVDVKIDVERTLGGSDLLTSMAKSKRTGIPWSAILDENGEIISESFMGERQNIGFPVTDEEIEAFMLMLTEGAKSMDKPDLAFLGISLMHARDEGK